MKRVARVLFPLLVLAIPFGGIRAVARDVFLTVGGGYSPQGNQVSLERNVLFYQRFLAQECPGMPAHDVYFADGNNPSRDLQFSNIDAVPDANWLMAELLGTQDSIDLEYRSHQVPGVRAEATEENLEAWFEEVGSTLRSGDRLILYVTAHGGRSRDRRRPFNTRLMLWDDDSVSVRELAEMISTLPEGVGVVVIMVQCYSGGFAHLAFNEAVAEKGHVDRDCCGFFATVHDRVAAGCTADIDEEDYQEYSTFFWEGMGGLSRTGERVELSDYDGDGEVSFAEAHAYVTLVSSTIDIPTKTSGAFLRTHSKLRSEEEPYLLSADSRYAYLLGLANPAEAAVLEGLSHELGLTDQARARAALALADEIEEQRKELAGEVSEKEDEQKDLKEEIADALKDRWPELDNLLSWTATMLLTDRATEFETAVQSHPKFDAYSRLGEEIAALEEERFALERRFVKCQRLVRWLENIALARNLPSVAPAEIVRRYERFIAAEESSLRSIRAPHPLPPDVGIMPIRPM
jgi:hypothetical protein